jgi:large subunit ribosomal protein L23
MELFEVIKRPLLTEKSARLKQAHPTYLFEVHDEATKIEIRRAVEKFFNVKVKKVSTLNVHGKASRRGRFVVTQPDWKKAYVVLNEGQKIESLEA